MPNVNITRNEFLSDRQGRTFSDVVNGSGLSFDAVMEFFSDEGRQRRMEESEIHHDRSPLGWSRSGVGGHPAIAEFLASKHLRRSKRLRQAVGVLVRMIMERRGWEKTGKKGFLGVRSPVSQGDAAGVAHNTGGLAFWFPRPTLPTARRNALHFRERATPEAGEFLGRSQAEAVAKNRWRDGLKAAPQRISGGREKRRSEIGRQGKVVCSDAGTGLGRAPMAPGWRSAMRIFSCCGIFNCEGVVYGVSWQNQYSRQFR